MLDKNKKKRICSHCEIEHVSRNNLCDYCKDLKRCKACTSILRNDRDINFLRTRNKDFSLENNISKKDKEFCSHCINRRNVESHIRDRCRVCNCKIRNNFDYFIMCGNFCRECLAKITIDAKFGK